MTRYRLRMFARNPFREFPEVSAAMTQKACRRDYTFHTSGLAS